MALSANARASSLFQPSGYEAAKAIDGDVDDGSRWVSRKGSKSPEWLELTFPNPVRIGGVHLYTGYQLRDPIENFEIQFLQNGKWVAIPSAKIEHNTLTALRIPFDEAVEVHTTGLRLYIEDTGAAPARVKELMVWPYDVNGIPEISEQISAANTAIPKIYLNQSGFNLGSPKRFTAPLTADGDSFTITRKGSNEVLYRGHIQKQIGDFSDFEPNSDEEYVIHVGSESSVPFRIGAWWLERVSYQGMIDFMVDSRHYVGNYTEDCVGTFAWRDDHHFSFELNTLVPMLLSNPDAYLRMPSQISYIKPEGEHAGKWGALEPYSEDAPDLVKLIHWGADVIVTQNAKHMLLKEQLAYFLYAWPVLQQWLPQQNYEVVKAYTLKHWSDPHIDRSYPYDETSENHNLFEVKKKIGSTKGGNPPGHSILPNVLMSVAMQNDSQVDAQPFCDAAYAQTEWVIKNVNWRDPLTTKGQRMSEHVTMTGLAAMMQIYPENSPLGLREKINDWAQVMVERSDNMWDFRKLSNTQWTPTGDKATHWNEPGNIIGFPASVLAALPYVDSPETRARLEELTWSHFDNAFGRNPTGRHFSYDAPREIEGVEHGWYSYHKGGIGMLANARFVFDGAPKNQHYPYHPDVGNIGWSEGWVAFNTAFNLSMSYLAKHETQIDTQRNGDTLFVRLRVPLNFNYEAQEEATVRVYMDNGTTVTLPLKEESTDSLYLSGSIQLKEEPFAVAYGYGYFETRQDITE